MNLDVQKNALKAWHQRAKEIKPTMNDQTISIWTHILGLLPVLKIQE